MTKRNNYNYQYPVGDEKIIKKLSDPKYKGGNIALPKDADEIKKIKSIICKSFLTYHKKKNLFCPCLDCGGNILPILLGDLVHSLKKQENLPTKIPIIYQALAQHQTLVH